jgi:PAS domain S-box-containing protein
MKIKTPSFYLHYLIPVYIIVIAVLAGLDIDTVYEPPLLLAALNTVFIGVFPIAVAVVAARTYTRGGPVNILWMGSGMLVFGAGSIIAGWVVQIDPNFTVTIHNISVMVSALFHAIGAVISLTPGVSSTRQTTFFKGRFGWVISYAAILVGLILLSFVVLSNKIPPFFIQGVGPTPIRQFILGLGIILFTFSASFFLSLYFKFRSGFMHWYIVYLGLIATGLLAVMIQGAVGSPLGWLGRSTQYLGGVFALVAILAARRSSTRSGTTIEDVIGSYLSDPQAGYRALEELVSIRTAALEEEITERKQSENNLTAAMQHLNAHIENSPLAVSEFNPQLRVIRWSDEAEQVFGWTAGEILGRSMFEIDWVLEEDVNMVSNDISGLINGERPRSRSTNRNYRKDGSVIWCEWYNSAIYDSDGNLVSILSLALDITERKRAEEMLELSGKIVQEAYDAIITTANDKNFTITSWNKGAEQVYGWTADEVIGQSSSAILMNEYSHGDHQVNLQNVLDMGRFEGEVVQSRKDGARINIDARLIALKDEMSNITGWVSVNRDITRRKQAEEAALASQKLASIGSLAAGMAHEINSPLQIVTGLTERLTRKLNADQIDKEQFLTDINTINRSGWRIANIIRSLLTYSRQSAHQIAPHQLNDIIESTLLLIEHQLISWSSISIEKELAQDLPMIHCDNNNITQLVINLLENARDAMPGGGWIKIITTCSPENEGVILQISDTGSGMPAEVQSRIFDPFFTTKEIGKGTGLGLSIVHGIVEVHSGEITVESTPEKGTTFSIRFPKEPPPIEPTGDFPVDRYMDL